MKQTKSITGIFLVLILTNSCKPSQTVQQERAKPIPASFSNNIDTINSATIKWRQFFSDENLISLIDTAMANNWDLGVAVQRIEAARSDILFAKGALKPTVAGNVGASLSKYGAYTMDGAGNKGTEIYQGQDVPEHLPDYFVGLQTTWEVDLWGKLKNQKRAAIARFLSTVEGRNLVITDLITEIASTYYELLALDQTLKIFDESIAIREKAYRMVKVQKEAGVTNELAVKQFEAQVVNLQASRLDVLQQMAEKESRINFLAGRFPQTIARDTTFFANKVPMQMRLGVPSALLQNRPDIRQAELELQASKADVLSAKAAFYPALNINGGIGFQAFKAKLLFTTPESVAYGLFGSLTAPLVNRAAIKAAFNKANAMQLGALYNYQKTIVNGFVEVYNEMLRIKNLQQVIELKTNEVNTLTQSINISEKLFRTDRANYLEVLFAQQNELAARLQLVETKKNQLLATVNMYKALGGGWR